MPRCPQHPVHVWKIHLVTTKATVPHMAWTAKVVARKVTSPACAENKEGKPQRKL